MDQAGSLRRMARGINGEIKAGASYGKLRGLAVASGKGGVGKTNTVANLAYALKREGKRALVFDADMGLGNIHILLGVAPRYNLDSVLSGEKTLDEIILRGPGGIEILPASSGAREFSELTGEEKLALKTELEALEENYDFIHQRPSRRTCSFHVASHAGRSTRCTVPDRWLRCHPYPLNRAGVVD
ncbi:Flagellar synthesis regulator FleN, partial [hydrothermal vent metagenome]